MNIFITDPHLKGGGQVRYVANLAGELVQLGHPVTIGCKTGSVLEECAGAARCGVHTGFVFRGGLRPNAWRNDLAEARRLIRESKPDVVHVNGSQDHWVFAAANRMLGRPVCLVRTRHNTYPVHNLLPNRILNRNWTDYQIVVCEEVRQRLAKQSAFDPARMCSIHNGVDAERFRPDPATRNKARTEFAYAEDEVVCGIAARLVPDKGHAFLFRSVAEIKGDFPRLRILVLGQGKLDEELKQLARDLGIGDTVQFAGFREDMAYCTQAIDIGVQPSIGCDTSSFSLKEQMAAEKPVVASDYGGLKEIVTDGEEGFVVPTATVRPLAEALRKLVRDPALRARMGSAGRRRVIRDFTIQIFAAKTLDAYRQARAIHQTRTAGG
ncbi:MAG TPA: glycosyltransferase family 4 protein [Candidatus Hydrogenedentes bacterium]|nr:glycosyltransferase family 4 protein [Candidatus Hydrogenedentota bacterium]